MSKLVTNACEGLDLPPKTIERTKNLCALGVLFWMYDRPLEPTLDWLNKKFKSKPLIIDANTRALHTGYNYGDTAEIFTTRYVVKKASLAPGKYRNINGTLASCLGILTASQKSNLNITFAGYPITPASNLLHTLSNWKNFGIKTFQAEDEIAGIGVAIGASYGGSLGITASSGPGIALKTEMMGLAVMTELPLVIINVQRGGPSTGLPTKTEQSDLLQAVYGRNGEAPIPVIAPIALKYPMERMDNIIGHNILNVNGDSSSGALAAAVKASQLIFLTDVEGVMDESGRLIELMTEENVNDLLESGVASGGMIPKLEAAIHALPYVEKVNIVDGRKPKAIINCYQGKSIGTTIIRR